ncbi:hypothetical protein FC789_05730 [Clostridium botulinum]|uniref:hypothetical protein n=1 Tax=Clostridium sp. ZBS12 TaxID=2949972 RepID=UPI0013F125E0|nr:hypothetical protein [Clostridium sp. ZBS12]NFG40696.1 hypothetical protein [Clostridium botulinum]
MKKINFDNIMLISEINKSDTKYVKCISEHNSSDSQNYKCLNFKVIHDVYNFEIRIFIQENDNNITIELLAENICKNIEVDDDVMEFIINEISIMTKLMKHKLEEYISIVSKSEKINKSIQIDTMFIDNIEFDKYNLEEIKNKVKNLYSTLKPNKVEYSNYTNKLYLFTRRGACLAKVLNELNIARFSKTRSGYAIKFLEEESRCTNSFNDKFARELSNMGVPSMSATNEYLDYSW